MRPFLSLALAVLVLAAAPAAAQQRPRQTDRDVDGLAGPVRRVTTSESTAGAPARKVETVVYDGEGRLVERVVYAAGVEVGRIAYSYDALGRRMIRTATPHGIGLGQWHTRLRPRERASESFVRGEDGMYVFIGLPGYDATGRLLAEVIHAGDDPTKTPPLARVMYRYNPEGRVSERLRFYGMPGAPVDKEVYSYDPEGRVTQAIHYRLSNALPTKRTFAYELDAAGNWTRRTETITLAGRQIVVVSTRTIEYL
jgi:YD repeat-containing protein